MRIDTSADTSTDDSRRSTGSEPSACTRAISRSIIVLGAGVIGLTIAHVLSDDPANKVAVVARELPDVHLFSQGWSSPWAGTNWTPLGEYSERKLRWEKATLASMPRETPTSDCFQGSSSRLVNHPHWGRRIHVFDSEKLWSMIPSGLVMVSILPG